jgi:hypothetical protein
MVFEKIVVVSILGALLSGCVAVNQTPKVFPSDSASVVEYGDYSVITLRGTGSKMHDRIFVKYHGEQIYEYKPRYVESQDIEVAPIYDDLANRASESQPKPFQDVLGNGLPDLVINESPLGYNRQEGVVKYLTVVSFDGKDVQETGPIQWTGEVVYFIDFNQDGCMEVVNTDWEQGFYKFDKAGVPMHRGVWRYDQDAGRYKENGTTLPSHPNTWPAYNNKASSTQTNPQDR